MAKILACSANGYGTGLMMKLTLDNVIATCGFQVEESAFESIMEGRKIASSYEIVLCPIGYVDMFADAAAKGTKVIGLNSVMAQHEMMEALENCGIDLKNDGLM